MLAWLLWLGTLGLVAFSILIVVLRFAVLPRVADYRDELQQAVAAALHRPVSIGRIEAGWLGLRPQLDIYDLKVQDGAGNTALALGHIEAVVGWTSLVYLQPRLYRLEISSPNLELLRRRDGRLFVAGIEVNTAGEAGGFGDWLLDQVQVAVTDARVTWTDELRAAPPLSMAHVNFRLDNGFRRHHFGLTFDPPAGSASAVDIRGDLHGSDLADLASWHGEVYAKVDAVDLAVWRTWIHYPIELPQGRGALRLWLEFADAHATGLTADVALTDTRIRLARNLPLLDLERIHGRVEGRLLENGFSAATTRLSLSTRDGLQLQPVDIKFRREGHEGEFDANVIDLSTLNRLAAYLPLPAELRKPLTEYAPGGQIHDLRLSWRGEQSDFEKFDIDARFEHLQLAAQGSVPGFSGLSGTVTGDEKSGRIELAGKQAGLDLPAVFAESHIPLDAVDIVAGWKRTGKVTKFTLGKASFRNQDAEGTASGEYTQAPGTMGVIDLDAHLSRGSGTAVWRYMPSVVDASVASWLHQSILEGVADNVTLKLKGPLDHFPFTDKSGIFRITGNISRARLRFAESWPQIDNIAGTLEFNGPRMTILARSGTILGTSIGPVKAEIPDLDHSETLLVSGKAQGPTASFLKYIEASPVGDSIDHFTEDMSAGGNGELELKLDIPLQTPDNAKIAGVYRFDGNRLVPVPGLPPIEDVRGRLEFTANSLSAKNLQGRMLGGPARAEVKTQPDGVVVITAGGDMVIAPLRQKMPNPLFDHLAGSTKWNGSIRVRKRLVEVRVASTLQGISSSLPAPFNKTAAESMPLLFERKPPDPLTKVATKRARDAVVSYRDQFELGIGKALRLKVMRHVPGIPGAQDRGLISIGEVTAKMPDKGVLLAANMARFDADFWRRVMAPPGDATDKPADTPPTPDSDPALGVSQIDIRAPEAVTFGRVVHDLKLTGNRQAALWNLDLRSREVAGKFEWLDGEPGKLSGRISQFTLPEAQGGASNGSGDALKELPNLDLLFERFVYRGMDLGQVRLAANNRDGYWDADISVQNDDASLTAQGKWRPSSTAPDTHFDFKLKAKNVERTLNRIGYPNTIRRANAQLEGALSWNAPPYDIHYPTLNGSLRLDAKDGQFNKLEPGVGRLLGIISLQSLPRRITLDFRDIFSEGFAFDAIKVRATVTRGIIDTQEMEINGPAARIQMAGRIDLGKETQDLKVRVQPSLGETAATGLLLANPAIGAGAWVLNKLFGNPLDKAFAYDYAVTGGWADPKVDKLGAQPGAAVKKEGDK